MLPTTNVIIPYRYRLVESKYDVPSVPRGVAVTGGGVAVTGGGGGGGGGSGVVAWITGSNVSSNIFY